MDSLYSELGIPKQQIKNTKTTNRFIVLTSKSWLKCLMKHKKVNDFPVYNLEQWPDNGKSCDQFKSWMIVNFCVSKYYLVIVQESRQHDVLFSGNI